MGDAQQTVTTVTCSGDHSREARRREGSRRVRERADTKAMLNTHPGNSWAPCLCELSWSHGLQRTSPLWEHPPTPGAHPCCHILKQTLGPSSQSFHILTFSGVSLFAFCLRRSALMNAEVKRLRKNNKDTINKRPMMKFTQEREPSFS